MSYLKGFIGGLCGLLTVYILYALWTLYLVYPHWRAVGGGMNMSAPLFWLMAVVSFWLGFYLAGRGA